MSVAVSSPTLRMPIQHWRKRFSIRSRVCASISPDALCFCHVHSTASACLGVEVGPVLVPSEGFGLVRLLGLFSVTPILMRCSDKRICSTASAIADGSSNANRITSLVADCYHSPCEPASSGEGGVRRAVKEGRCLPVRTIRSSSYPDICRNGGGADQGREA